MPKPKKSAKKRLPVDHAPLPEDLDNGVMHDLSHQRDERCVPLAHALIKLLAEQPEMPVGGHVEQKLGETDYYAPTVRTFLSELIEKDVMVSEVVYIFTLARQALDFVQGSIDETINQNMNRNTETMYGLKHNDFDLITVKDLNRVVMRRHLLTEAWKPVLEKEVENEHPVDGH